MIKMDIETFVDLLETLKKDKAVLRLIYEVYDDNGSEEIHSASITKDSMRIFITFENDSITRVTGIGEVTIYTKNDTAHITEILLNWYN